MGLTDSQVSAAVVARGMSTTYPLCCVAMELAAQLEERGLELDLAWTPRDLNAEADRLADGDYSGFSANMRRGGSLSEVPWLVLPGLLRMGGAFYEAAGVRQEHARPSGQKKRTLAGERLKDREPW